MANPLQQSFWQEEEQALWELMSFLGMTVYLAGAQSAVTMLPGAVQHNAWWDAMALQRCLAEAGNPT